MQPHESHQNGDAEHLVVEASPTYTYNPNHTRSTRSISTD